MWVSCGSISLSLRKISDMQFVRHVPGTFQEEVLQPRILTHQISSAIWKANMEKCTTITWKQIKKTEKWTGHQESTKLSTNYKTKLKRLLKVIFPKNNLCHVKEGYITGCFIHLFVGFNLCSFKDSVMKGWKTLKQCFWFLCFCGTKGGINNNKTK